MEYEEGYEHYISEDVKDGEIRRIVYKKGKWVIETHHERSYYLHDPLFEILVSLSEKDRFFLGMARNAYSK